MLLDTSLAHNYSNFSDALEIYNYKTLKYGIIIMNGI